MVHVYNGKSFSLGQYNNSIKQIDITSYANKSMKEWRSLLNGKGIKKNKNGRPVNLVDITPTISHILGIKPPEQSEGKIILDIFE